MEKEHIYIADFDFSLITDYFKDLDRQGPCSVEATLMALSLIGPLPSKPRIADLGCGTGGQTITLAQHTDAVITAIDIMPGFIETLRDNVEKLGLKNRIFPVEGSMEDIPFGDEELDVIWAEGSIYHMGYENGLRKLRRHLKPGGIFAVSEASWLTESRPAKIQRYWDGEYPQIDTIPTKIAQMQAAGYSPLAHFVLSPQCWHNYFAPMKENSVRFLERHGNSQAAQMMVHHIESEIAQYDEFGKYYGYVFYIGRKDD